MTFSLLGRCARTGQIGAVVTTSAMAVGSRCAFARAGVGAVLTQHRTDPRLGPVGLEILSLGFGAKQALAGMVGAAGDRDWRQLAVIDAAGDSASFSGARVRAEKGEAHGEGCVAIANIVRSAQVPSAMVTAFEEDPSLVLGERLVRAILAGEAAGGEFAAVVSAALLVVHRERFAYVDLRVDAHGEPLAELARLWAAYAPLADDYVLRAVAPDSAAAYVAPPARGA